MAAIESFALHLNGEPVRADLGEAFRRAWDHIASAGPGWSSRERVAIATEARNAWDCSLCTERKAALTPNAVKGAHDASDVLSAAAVDAVHRIATDVSRLTELWFDDTAAAGVSDVQYAEIIGIVSTVASIDAFFRALDLPLEPLPQATDAQATGYRPEGLKSGGAWLPMVPPGDVTGADSDLYHGMKQTGRVIMAMSCAPDEVRNLMQVATAMYMSDRDVANFKATGNRAISRPQIELLASRVSAINECFY